MGSKWKISSHPTTANSALRIISFRPFRSDVLDLYKSLNILSFHNLVRISNNLFVYDSLTHRLPLAISNYFTQVRNVHSYLTRNSLKGNLVVPIFKSNKYGRYSIKYQCITEWNKNLSKICNKFLIKYNNLNLSTFLELNMSQFPRLIKNIIYSQ